MLRPTSICGFYCSSAANACATVAARDSEFACVSRLVSVTEENVMGKYLVAWILGVPAIVLVIVYFFAH